jgi:ABC-type Fe3+-siderophore transport system permease subunit
MRPLTLERLLLRCGLLALILFGVVVVSLKMGAVQVSLYGLGRDLIHVLLGRSSAISTDYGMIVLNIRLPRILLGMMDRLKAVRYSWAGSSRLRFCRP